MVFITGDCHGNFSRFKRENFPEQLELTRDDIVIVCGDFGIWKDTAKERHNLNWLSHKPFTIAFVDGNHENFDRLYSNEFPIVNFYGSKAHKIRDNICHLMRGNIYEIEGHTFFCFGGASSHDIEDGILDRKDFMSVDEFYETVYLWRKQYRMFRINHESLWERELPTVSEMEWGRKDIFSQTDTANRGY